ncbi:hypothetical protein [Sphingomonas sp. 1P08PE]|uniref:hypothetical protein n=1 Tax=Sphingomonas sp. 1P08PE TaxID=554122 RepID=UPI0039A214D0
MTGSPPGGPVGVMAHVLFFYGLLLLACSYAALAGGAPERVAAAILLLGTVATWVVAIAGRGYYAGQFRSAELGILAVDATMLLALLALSLSADRFWPLWLTAIHGFGVVGHIARLIAPDILTDVYKAAHALSAYPALLLLIAATRWHRRRLATEGHDRSWSICWPSSMPSTRKPAPIA